MGTNKADRGEITELLNRCDECLAYASQPGDHHEDCFRFKGRTETEVIMYSPKTHQTKPVAKQKSISDDNDVIGDLMGQYGKYQFLMTFLLSLFQVPNTFHISSGIFQAADKTFWCERPHQLLDMPVDAWRSYSGSEDNCNIAEFDWRNVTSIAVLHPSSSWNATLSILQRTKCTAWEYNTTDDLGNTWTSEWDLVCDKKNLKNVAEMFFLAGVATGGIISGYLSDKFGRKRMLFISVVLQTIFGFALYFATSIEVYLGLRVLLGLMSVSVTYSGLILAIEFVDGKWRTIAGMYNLFPLPVSYMLISGIAYLTQDFRQLQLFIGIPGVFLCFLWFVIPESPRWLLCKGRLTEVKAIIRSACEFNGREVPEDMEKMLKPPLDEQTDESCVTLFGSKYLRLITICFLCIWFAMNMVYYGLTLNINEFGINVYLISALAGLVEIPAIAIAIFIIMKTGKKWILFSTFIGTGLACMFVAIVDSNMGDLMWPKISLLMIGKFMISAGNTIMPVYTAELYPTAIRNAGVGACNIAAGLALVCVPYMPMLNIGAPYYLMVLLTVCSLFGGVVVVFLPESEQKQPPVAEAREERC